MRFSAYDGTQLEVTEVGPGSGSYPPLVCIPGGPGRAAAYLEDLAGLSQVRTLLRLDLRATGRSVVPADLSTMRFDRQADDVEALREHLGLATLDVFGHSAGCIVAQCWASQHPTAVGRLLLVTPSDVLQGGRRTDTEQVRASFSGEPWYADAAEAYDAIRTAPPAQQQSLMRATRPFMYSRWDERTQEHAAGADTQSSKRAELGFATGKQEVDKAGLVAGLAAVTAPVLVVGADRDALTGLASVDLVAGSFPTAQTAVITDAGHFPWVDAPDGFRAAVDPFLE